MSAAIETWQQRCDITRRPEGVVERAMVSEIADLRAALADRQVAAPIELMPDLDLAAFDNAIRNLGLIGKGLALSKNHDLDGSHIGATIKHAKQMANAVLPRFNAAYSDLVTTLRSARAAARHAATTPPLCPECQAREARGAVDPVPDGGGHHEYIEQICDAYKAGAASGSAGDPYVNPHFFREFPDAYTAYKTGHSAATQPPLRLALPDHEREAARYRLLMQLQDGEQPPPEAISEMWRKVTREHRLKPTREEYDAAIDAAIAGNERAAGKDGASVASIDTPEFNKLALAYWKSSGGDLRNKRLSSLIGHIDARLLRTVVEKASNSVNVWADQALDLLESMTPAKNCTCCISPPCSDCVDWSHHREVAERLREALVGVRK